VRLGEAWHVRAWMSWTRCRAEATAQALERALAYAAQAGDEATLGQARNLLIGTWLFGPTPVEEAIRRCNDILADDAAAARTRASACRALGGLMAMQGRFADARPLLERDREIHDELGLRVLAGVAAEIWGLLELLADQPQAAEERLRAGIAVLEPMGETSGVSTLTAMLAEAVYRQGRDGEVLALTDLSGRLAPRRRLLDAGAVARAPREGPRTGAEVRGSRAAQRRGRATRGLDRLPQPARHRPARPRRSARPEQTTLRRPPRSRTGALPLHAQREHR
jgi:hypothetical protein